MLKKVLSPIIFCFHFPRGHWLLFPLIVALGSTGRLIKLLMIKLGCDLVLSLLRSWPGSVVLIETGILLSIPNYFGMATLMGNTSSTFSNRVLVLTILTLSFANPPLVNHIPGRLLANFAYWYPVLYWLLQRHITLATQTSMLTGGTD